LVPFGSCTCDAPDNFDDAVFLQFLDASSIGKIFLFLIQLPTHTAAGNNIVFQFLLLLKQMQQSSGCFNLMLTQVLVLL
jgi:hypothetical protein